MEKELIFSIDGLLYKIVYPLNVKAWGKNHYITTNPEDIIYATRSTIQSASPTNIIEWPINIRIWYEAERQENKGVYVYTVVAPVHPIGPVESQENSSAVLGTIVAQKIYPMPADRDYNYLPGVEM